jgi:hypothetical protein
MVRRNATHGLYDDGPCTQTDNLTIHTPVGRKISLVWRFLTTRRVSRGKGTAFRTHPRSAQALPCMRVLLTSSSNLLPDSRMAQLAGHPLAGSGTTMRGRSRCLKPVQATHVIVRPHAAVRAGSVATPRICSRAMLHPTRKAAADRLVARSSAIMTVHICVLDWRCSHLGCASNLGR